MDVLSSLINQCLSSIGKKHLALKSIQVKNNHLLLTDQDDIQWEINFSISPSFPVDLNYLARTNEINCDVHNLCKICQYYERILK